MTKANNSFLMKEQNSSHVLRLIRKEPISRAEIARQTGLTRSAVSVIVDRLLEENLIFEGTAVKSSNGRRPTLLHLNVESFFAYGIDITRDGCTLCVCDFSGKLIEKEFINFLSTEEESLDLMENSFQKIKKENVLGVGISAPGPIDKEKGLILDPPNLKLFKNFNIKEKIEKRLGLPVFFEKDTNALALLEKNKSEHDNFLYLLADHGLGGALIKNGALFKGHNGAGCEIGHVSLSFQGEKCSCGNVGCASLYTSIGRTLKSAGKSDYKDLCFWASQGETDSLNAIKYQGEMLSHALITFVNLMEPEKIILGGQLKEGIAFLKPIIEENLKKHAFTRSTHSISVEESFIDDRACAPANMVLEDYFMKG